jgi:hypothetical protein
MATLATVPLAEAPARLTTAHPARQITRPGAQVSAQPEPHGQTHLRRLQLGSGCRGQVVTGLVMEVAPVGAGLAGRPEQRRHSAREVDVVGAGLDGDQAGRVSQVRGVDLVR